MGVGCNACRYYLLIGLIVAPLLAVGNAYGTGLTDWNMSSLYTKVRAVLLFMSASWDFWYRV